LRATLPGFIFPPMILRLIDLRQRLP